MNQISSEGGVAVTFSGAGNMTSDGVNTYVYTFGNRLVSATRTGMTATYDYDSVDRRTKKIVNGVMTRTLWSGADELAELDVYGDGLRRFIPDGSGAMDGRLATVEANGTVYWHHTDHQGSVIATSDSAGQTVGVASYSPYGEFGSGQSAPPLGSPFGYTGRQYDVETGLYQYRARYDSPRLGQFLSSDPIGTKDDPNLYLYVGNDPVNLTDPTGECPPIVCGAILGGGAGAGIEIAAQVFLEGRSLDNLDLRRVGTQAVNGAVAGGIGAGAGALIGRGLQVTRAARAAGAAEALVGGAVGGATSAQLSGSDPVTGAVTGLVVGRVASVSGARASAATQVVRDRARAAATDRAAARGSTAARLQQSGAMTPHQGRGAEFPVAAGIATEHIIEVLGEGATICATDLRCHPR